MKLIDIIKLHEHLVSKNKNLLSEFENAKFQTREAIEEEIHTNASKLEKLSQTVNNLSNGLFIFRATDGNIEVWINGNKVDQPSHIFIDFKNQLENELQITFDIPLK